ncbi:MAG: acylphosphatase [Bacteroidales bacterium]|nr:acylphosphatase [Bacteroidales bacterium]
MPEKCVGISIRGRVQGVGFRYQTQNAARKFGIKGFVKNMPDGSVYAEACGEERNIELFVDWCRKGPMLARVTSVNVQEVSGSVPDDFDIRF